MINNQSGSLFHDYSWKIITYKLLNMKIVETWLSKIRKPSTCYLCVPGIQMVKSYTWCGQNIMWVTLIS